jgi:acetoin utilization deacetylase AcuC-like enzyme
MVADISHARSLQEGDAPPIMITPDTYANEHTNLCARLAAGSAAEVACLVASGKACHGAAIVRPPGGSRTCVQYFRLAILRIQ